MSELAILESPAPATSAMTRPAMADLILLRLLTEKKSIAPKKLREDLAVFFQQPPMMEQIGDTVAALKAEGFMVPKLGQCATDAGRAKALQFLGIEKLPPRANWKTVKTKFLAPRALGLQPETAECAKVMGSSGTLAAFLLKRKLRLPPSTESTLNAVVEALICRELGHPDFTNVSDLIAFAIGKAVNGEPIKRLDARQVLPRVILNVSSLRMENLLAGILSGRSALGEPTSSIEEFAPDETFDLTDFANTVIAEARRCPTGRFGESKVFINHVWNQFCDEPRFAPLNLDGFKAKLVEANHANLLTLSRADLVQLMDPADVRESETNYLNATFHFILVEGN